MHTRRRILRPHNMAPTLIEFPHRGNLALTPVYHDQMVDADRRAHTRLSGDEVPWLAGIRLKYGPAVRVIDVSRGGAQIETLAHRLNPGATVVCEIAAVGKGLVIPAQVVRCHVAQLLPEPSYRGSIAFKRPLDLPGFDLAAGATAAFQPVHEHARLVRALRKRAARRGDSTESSHDHPFVAGGDALSAALALLHAPAGRRAGETFSRELALLFRTVANGLDADFPTSMVVASLEDRLTRAIGLRAARLAVSSMGASSAESLCFDVPAPSAHVPRKLLVEFRERQELAEWHFHLLRAAVHLFALLRELDAASPAIAAAAGSAAPPQLPAARGRPFDGPAGGDEISGERTPPGVASVVEAPRIASVVEAPRVAPVVEPTRVASVVEPPHVTPVVEAPRELRELRPAQNAPSPVTSAANIRQAASGPALGEAAEATSGPPSSAVVARDVLAPANRARVVVRYTDGRLLKGFSREFNPANGYIEVWAAVTAPAEARIRIPFGALKAVFFVRDFDGNPNRLDATVIDQPRSDGRRGRPITVTFLDDEVLAGTTMNYQVDGPGFFVTPHDDGANNERVFVLSRAIRHVRFG